eukprot:2584810-Rhodomonas_salina.1
MSRLRPDKSMIWGRMATDAEGEAASDSGAGARSVHGIHSICKNTHGPEHASAPASSNDERGVVFE